MPHPRLTTRTAVPAIALLITLLTGAPASAAPVDTTPPTTPPWGYAQGFYCLTAILGVHASTDDVTPQAELRYEAFADGVFLGLLTNRGADAWGVLTLNKVGSNTVTVQAVDAAGNRSAPNRPVVVRGYYTPGCTPGLFP